MAVEWSTTHQPAAYVEEPGDVCDDFGTQNDGAALVFDSGAGGAFVVEGEPHELRAWLLRALALIPSAPEA